MKSIRKILISVSVLIAVFAFSAITVFAQIDENALSAPILKGTNKTSSSITLEWTDESDIEKDGYEIYSYDSETDNYEILDTVTADTNTYVVNDLESGQIYKFAVRSYAEDKATEENIYSPYSEAAEYATMPETVRIDSIARDTTKLTVSYTTTNCTSYQVKYSTNADMSDYKTKSITENTNKITITGLSSATNYYVQIRSYTTLSTGTKIYGSWSDVSSQVTKPAQMKITSTSSSSATSIKVAWNSTAATKYQLQCSTKSNFSSNLKTITVSASAKTKTITNLKANTGYYVRIRAYKTFDEVNVYGAWSAVQKQITKPAQMKITSTSSPSTTSIKVAWNSAAATKYQLQYSTKSDFSSDKKTFTLSTSVKNKTITNLKTNKAYYVRIRAYQTRDKVNVYGAWSEVKKQVTYPNKKIVTSTQFMKSNKWASSTISSIKSGATVRYAGSTGNWCKIIYNGKTGYVYNLAFKRAGSVNLSRSKVTAKNYTTYLDDLIFVKGKNTKTLFKYVQLNMSYSYSKISTAQKNANINSKEKVAANEAELTAVAIKQRGGICYNYAAFLKTLLQRAGYNVQYIYGSNRNGEHCWVLIKTNGKYRHMDVIKDAYMYTDKQMHNGNWTRDEKWDAKQYPACV